MGFASPLPLASNSEAPTPSISPLVVESDDLVSHPKENIALWSQTLENLLPPRPPSPRTRPHQGGQCSSPPPPTPHQSKVASSNPSGDDDTHWYVSICGQRVQVLEGYPKDA